MTPTSVASSTPPTARSPTRCTCSTSILGYTIELDGGSGAPVGGTTTAGNAVGSNPAGFVFQDREADVQAVFAKNLPFMLDLAKSAPTPDQPSSHIGAQIPDFVPASFPTSYGTPQTVEVNVAPRARRRARSSGRSRAPRPSRPAPPTEFNGGERYGQSGVYYHRMRGSVTGFKAGDKVKVWFEAGGKTLGRRSPSPPRPLGRGNQVLVLSRRGLQRACHRTRRPARVRTSSRPTPRRSPTPASPPTSTTSTRSGRTLADLHGVLSHYKAVIWYTGLDDFVRDPGQTVGISKMFDDQMIAVRDYLNEGGKVLVTGQRALDGAWSQYSYNPLGRVPGQARSAVRTRTRQTGRADRPARELRADLQRLPAVLDGRERAGRRSSSSATAISAADDRRPGAVHEHVLADRPGVPAAASRRPRRRCRRPRSRTSPSAKATHTALIGTTNGDVGVSTDDTLLWGFGLENVAVAGHAQGARVRGPEVPRRRTRTRRRRARPGGTVPATLSLSLGAPASFGAFTPGVDARVHGVDDGERDLHRRSTRR